MDVLLLTRMLVVLSLVKSEQSIIARDGQQDYTKKEIIVVNSPKTHHHAGVLVYGQEEGSGDSESKASISALSSNLQSLNDLVQTQSEVIRNLGFQVTKFQESLDSGSVKGLSAISGNNTKDISKLKKTVNHLTKTLSLVSKKADKNAAAGITMLQTLEQKLATFEEKTRQMVLGLENRLRKIVQKANKIEYKVNKIQSRPRNPGWPRGNYCILAKGRCPQGFRRRRGFIKSVYLYSSSDRYIKPSRFGSSWIGCFGDYCGQYGNFIGSINIVACCK